MKRITFLATLSVSMAATILLVDSQAHAAAPPTPQGFITAKEFLDIGGSTTIPDLTNNAKFPNNPDIVNYPARFEWPTGPDDVTTAPADVRNDYGIQIIGYFYPPVTGQYRFAVASDDNSIVYLSTDSNPANKSAICAEAGWNTIRNWDDQTAGRGRALIAAGTPDERWNNQSKPI